MKHLLASLALLFCLVPAFELKAQDLIFKTNGDTIKAKLLEISVNTVTYKRLDIPDGPTYVINKSEVVQVKYSNGTIEKFSEAAADANSTQATGSTSTASTPSNTSSQPEKNKIELVDGKFFVNGKNAKRKEVNGYLARSKNPAVVLGLKGAKGMGLAQTITKITAYPTTIIGGITSVFYLAEGYQLVQRGRATRKTFWNMGLSVVSTITMPITSKILKKQNDKMYKKLIDLYNVTN